jgi:holo-[acyl-carrier protein] synthase
MIVGIGTDLVQIKRMERLLITYGNRFKSRILEERELRKLESLPIEKHASFLAKRFAAKEAIGKALGTGISKQLAFKDIAILNDEYGKPYAEINHEKLDSNKNFMIHLSISDDYPVAIAFSVISI